jgi:DNA/RNA endonuclease YhcR with UshA esterase domain
VKIAIRTSFSLFVLGLLGPSLGLAHHGDAGRYSDEVLTVTGTVVEFRLVNPHSVLIIAVEDEQGNVVEWHGELGSPVSLSNNWGWTRDTFQPGDTVTMTGRPQKSGAPYMTLSEGARVLDAEGNEIYRGR